MLLWFLFPPLQLCTIIIQYRLLLVDFLLHFDNKKQDLLLLVLPELH